MPPVRKPEPAPKFDRNNPLLRFSLFKVGVYRGIPKAYLKDLLQGSVQLVEVGGVIGDFKLVRLSIPEQSARLKSPDGREFDFYRDRPAEAVSAGAAPAGP